MNAAKQFRAVVQDRRIAGRGWSRRQARSFDLAALRRRGGIRSIFAGHIVLLHLLQDNIFEAAKFRDTFRASIDQAG
jgi:hypothetical protein